MSQHPPEDRLLTTKQLSVWASLSERTIQRRIAAGEIKTIKIGRSVRIPSSEVARILGKAK